MTETVDPAAAALFSSVPVNQTLGMTLEVSQPGTGRISMPADQRFTQETGILQGGIITTLADTAAVYGLFPFLEAGRSLSGIELKINFLRAARSGGADLVAVSRIVHKGRTTAVVEVEITQQDKLLAKATFTFLILTAS